MLIRDLIGNELEINANVNNLTIDVTVNGGYTFSITLEQVKQLLPSLGAAKSALEEAGKVKQKSRVADLRQKIVDITKEIEAIEKL